MLIALGPQEQGIQLIGAGRTRVGIAATHSRHAVCIRLVRLPSQLQSLLVDTVDRRLYLNMRNIGQDKAGAKQRQRQAQKQLENQGPGTIGDLIKEKLGGLSLGNEEGGEGEEGGGEE